MNPDAKPDFLETTTGANWQAMAAEQLIMGKGLKIGNVQYLEADALADRLLVLTAKALIAGRDTEGNYAQMLLAAALGDGRVSRACFEGLMGRRYAEELALEMVAPFAVWAEKQMAEDAENER